MGQICSKNPKISKNIQLKIVKGKMVLTGLLPCVSYMVPTLLHYQAIVIVINSYILVS